MIVEICFFFNKYEQQNLTDDYKYKYKYKYKNKNKYDYKYTNINKVLYRIKSTRTLLRSKRTLLTN